MVANQGAPSAPAVKLAVRDLSAWYGEVPALRSVTLQVQRNEILAIIGPANSGKTTFLRILNRLVERAPEARVEGEATLDGRDILREMPAEELRTRVGMVFALPIPLPLSIFENVAYGPRRHGVRGRRQLEQIVEESLRSASLWDEVKNRLNEPAMRLSGGQQQRLCIARTLAVQAEVIMLDEPCSGLDPISTALVEDALVDLKQTRTVILVTNLPAQAARVSDRTAFFLGGELVELDAAAKIFLDPADERTAGYVEGRFG